MPTPRRKPQISWAFFETGVLEFVPGKTGLKNRIMPTPRRKPQISWAFFEIGVLELIPGKVGLRNPIIVCNEKPSNFLGIFLKAI